MQYFYHYFYDTFYVNKYIGWFKCQIAMENFSMGQIPKSQLVTKILPLKFNILRIL